MQEDDELEVSAPDGEFVPEERAAENEAGAEAEAVVAYRRRFQRKLPSPLVDDAARADGRSDGEGRGALGAHQLGDGPR